MKKMLVFDMDGTIADLYGVDGWFDDILAKNVRPYVKANPLYDMDVVVILLEMLKGMGWTIAVTSWLAKVEDNNYAEAVTKAKVEWLNRFGFPYDILNIVKYGVDKSSVTKKYGGYQILFDDEEKNLTDWVNGDVVDAKNDIIKVLLDLIDKG